MQRADLTLTAGPNPVSARVAAALGSPIMYHYDPVFGEHFRETERMVAEIYGTSSHEIILNYQCTARCVDDNCPRRQQGKAFGVHQTGGVGCCRTVQ